MAEVNLSLGKEPTEPLPDNPVEALEDPGSVPATHSSPEINPACPFFLEGRCRFGDRCRNHHPGGITDADHVEEHRPNCKTAEQLPVSKKPPMKTAEDVISRLLWDPQVPAECFSIGYLDRFLGVVEQPFAAFSWEDLASVGPGVLAIPKHRIHYFKYGTRVVWDKVSRTDDVFGSTGSGRTILDVMKEEDQAIKETSDSHPSNEGARKETGALEGAAKHRGEERDVCVSVGEKQLNRTATGNDEVRENEEAMGCLKLIGDTRVTLDGNIVTEGKVTEAVSSVMDGYSIKEGKVDTHIFSIEQEDEPLMEESITLEKEARVSFPCLKRRTTHFIAIPVTSPEVREAVKLFQEALCEVRPDLAEFCVPLATLHLTVGLLHLNTPEDISKAVLALQELQAKSQRLLPPALLLSFHGVENFYSRVLYMAPGSVPELGLLAQTLEDAFSKKDLTVIHLPSKEKFHLTMVKIPRRKARLRLPEDPSWLPTIEHLGTQAVETLCLCEVGTGKTDRFYSTVLKIDLY